MYLDPFEMSSGRFYPSFVLHNINMLPSRYVRRISYRYREASSISPPFFRHIINHPCIRYLHLDPLIYKHVFLQQVQMTSTMRSAC
jgi:hypothetical protein